MTVFVLVSLLASVPVPPECEAPPTRDVVPLKAFAQKSGTLSVGLDSVATWCFDSAGGWTGGQRPEGKKPKPIDPNAPAVGDCARALASCDEAKLALTDELTRTLTETLADLERPYRSQKYVPKRSGLSEKPSPVVNCRERSRPDLFAQAQARMDLARLASTAQNEYANYKTWLFTKGLECAQQVRAGKVDTTRVSVTLDAPNTPGAPAGGVAGAGGGAAGKGLVATVAGMGAASAGGSAGAVSPGTATTGVTTGTGAAAGGPGPGPTSAGTASASGTDAPAPGVLGGTRVPTTGPGTTATGPGTTASGSGTTAMGSGTAATGPGTTATGPGTKAPGTGTTASGAGTIATGPGTTTTGSGTAASASGTTASGAGTTATGPGTTTTGSGATATSPGTTGVGTTATRPGTTSPGVATTGAGAGSAAGSGTTGAGTSGLSSSLIATVTPPTTGTTTAPSGVDGMLDTWRGLSAQRGKMELDRDYTLGFLASRELRDCRCQRANPAGIVARLQNNDGVAPLEADHQRAMNCELCLQNAFAAWKTRIGKQCALLVDLSPYELEVLQKSDDGNGIPPRCWEEVVARRGLDGGVLLASPPPVKPPAPVATAGPLTVKLPVDAGTRAPPATTAVVPTGMPKFEPPSPLADGFFRPNEPAPIPLREDGRLYVRLFMSSTCAADVLPGPLLARTGDLLLIPYGASTLSLRSPCGGLAEVYWGKEPTPRVSEVFGRNQPLYLQFKAQ